MYIKRPAPFPFSAFPSRKGKRSWTSRLFRVSLRLVFVALILLGAERVARLSWTELSSGAAALTQGVEDWWRQQQQGQYPGLRLHIDFEAMQRLAYERELALQRGFIVQHEESYVPATIELPDRMVAARVRLKGDIVDHLEGKKWSLRVRVKAGEDAVFGMRTFSIQDPRRSGFIYEFLFHEIMRREGVLAPRYGFMPVRINGEAMGIYAIEESFGKELLEAHQRREGPIVKFDESQLFEGLSAEQQSAIFFAAPVDAFFSTRIAADSVLSRQFAIARALLDGFRNQETPVQRAFDVDKLATYFALVDLCSAHHAARWKNIRFYYNPVSSVLEPIPYNAYSYVTGEDMETGWLLGRQVYGGAFVDQWLDLFFQDPEFYRAYVVQLERVSQPSFLRELLEELDSDLQRYTRVLATEFPDFVFRSDFLHANAQMMRNTLHPHQDVQAHFDPDELQPVLRVANPVWLSVELVAIRDRQADTSYAFCPAFLLPPKPGNLPSEVPVPLPADARSAFSAFERGRFELIYRAPGLVEERRAAIHQLVGEAERNLPQRAAQAESQIDQHEALKVDHQQAEVLVRPGSWRLRESLYIPAGYTVRAGAGVVIELVEGASLISYSPLAFEGTRDAPVVIRSPDGSGGVCVLQTDSPSRLDFVRFENLASPSEGLWTTTGAVTFYEAPVFLSNVRFEGGTSEDQLNLVRSRLELQTVVFSGSLSDALDIDFGRGLLQDCSFEASGNDAIDLSGSALRLLNIRVEAAGDKGLSVGEASEVDVEGLWLSGCRIGVASKDMSVVRARGLEISDSEVGMAVYRKKSEYGPASIDVTGLRVTGVAEPSLVERGSWLRVEGQRTAGTRLRLAESLE